ncbi:hypothetical protein ACFLTU_00985 [Bacteroidota bacterium]
MKKTTIILTLAFGLAILGSSTVQAIQAMHFPGHMLAFSISMDLENEIRLQNWMLLPDSFSESADSPVEMDIKVEDWMLDGSWGNNPIPVVSETEIGLEDWMLNVFDTDNRAIALEDWMLSTKG